MLKMIAYCGLNCTVCPAFIATSEDDEEKRRKVASEWNSEQYPLKQADINCDGCLPDNKRLIKFCFVCTIRSCCREKELENCAFCDDYICEKLEKFYKMMQSDKAKATLDEIRESNFE